MSLELSQTLSVSSGEVCIPPTMTKLQASLTLARGSPNWLARVEMEEEAKRWPLRQFRLKFAEAMKPEPPTLQLQGPSDHGS